MAAGDYGAHEYEVTASVRVYGDTPDEAFDAGVALIRRRDIDPDLVTVRLIDDEEEE